MFACLILSESIHNIPWAIQPPNSSQISTLPLLPSLKADSGYQSPGAYVQCNFISMKVKESFTFHLKSFTKCSNYSTPFLKGSWSGYSLLLICFHMSCFYNKPFIQRVDTVYMLHQALTCVFQSVLVLLIEEKLLLLITKQFCSFTDEKRICARKRWIYRQSSFSSTTA